jgi:hypothetical protein
MKRTKMMKTRNSPRNWGSSRAVRRIADSAFRLLHKHQQRRATAGRCPRDQGCLLRGGEVGSEASHGRRLVEIPRNGEHCTSGNGVESRVQDMSWNEWKTASASALRSRFYLYLVGNLRSDLEGARPFVRTIRNPFEQLTANVQVNNAVSRKVQLAVYLFKEAEQQYLSVIPRPSSAALQQESPP